MNTPQFKSLIKRIGELKENLIRPIHPSEMLNAKEQDWLRGFRCLIHAEIETYFEETAKEVVLEALQKWESQGASSKVLTSVIAFTPKKDPQIETSWRSEDAVIRKNLYHTSRIKNSINAYMSKLEKNHGVKADNLLNILLPTGVSLDEIDNTWINTMNSFGEERGRVAHSAATALKPIDRTTEVKNVALMLRGIKKIDQRVCILRNE